MILSYIQTLLRYNLFSILRHRQSEIPNLNSTSNLYIRFLIYSFLKLEVTKKVQESMQQLFIFQLNKLRRRGKGRVLWSANKLRNALKVGEEQFKYLGTTLPNQNSIQEEIKSRLKSGNACFHSVKSLLSSSLLSKNIKTKMSRTITLPVVLYGCQTWSLKRREKDRMRVFENTVEENIWASEGRGNRGVKKPTQWGA